ncbi:MAG TPA: response regulator [Terriglobales bacterium]|nr:response regulator [Terriglobales bacterium]
MKLRAAIVDDEPLARQILREMLAAPPLAASVEVVAECANGLEAVKAAQELKPDVIFLDIQMPKLDGFEVLELLRDDREQGRDPGAAVVFVTAHDAYALRAFEVHAVDYLLKPFTAERLETALRHALERRAPLPATALAAAAHPGYLQRVVVRNGPKVTIIPVSKLDYAEAQDDYVALATAGKKHLKQQTIASLEAALDPKEFVRIHRSYLVRVERVERLEPYGKDSQVAVLDAAAGAARLPVSRAGLARLRTLLG